MEILGEPPSAALLASELSPCPEELHIPTPEATAASRDSAAPSNPGMFSNSGLHATWPLPYSPRGVGQRDKGPYALLEVRSCRPLVLFCSHRLNRMQSSGPMLAQEDKKGKWSSK